MKLKKFTAIALATTLAFSSLVGCSKDESKDNAKASVFDLLKEETDNATMSLKFNYSEDETKSSGNLTLSYDKGNFSLDNVKLSEEGGETIEISKLLSGGKDAIYLNVGTFMESSQDSESLGQVASILSLIFQDVEYLKIELPETKEISTKEITDEFVKNLETALNNAGFNFVASEDGKTFTLKVSTLEGNEKIAKELLTQMKASGDVYAKYIMESNNNVSSDSVKDYVQEQVTSIFEEMMKYYGATLTNKNKETLSTYIGEWVEENVSVSYEEMTLEDAKTQFEETIDEKLAEINGEYDDEELMPVATMVSMETSFVVTDTEDGTIINIEIKSEDSDEVKYEGTFELTITNGNANVSFPEKSTALKDIVGNVMPLVDGFGILGDISSELEGATEEEIDEFITSIFDGSLFESDYEDEESWEDWEDDYWDDEDWDDDEFSLDYDTSIADEMELIMYN